MWKTGHAPRGPRATPRLGARLLAGKPLALVLALALSSAFSRAAQAESFGRRLAERAWERGSAQEARGDIALALTSYDDAVRADPSFGPALLGLGALRERLGQPNEAELLYSRAAEIAETRAEALYRRALMHRNSQRRREATEDLARSVELEPAPERLHLLAGWYVESHTWPAALAVWRALLSDALARGDANAQSEAQLTLSALVWLAGETDPVLSGASSESWVRRSLSRIAARTVTAQGARKLTP